MLYFVRLFPSFNVHLRFYLAVQFCYCLLKITLQKVTPADSENAKVSNSVPHSRHTFIRAERTVGFSKENHCAVTLMQQQKRGKVKVFAFLIGILLYNHESILGKQCHCDTLGSAKQKHEVHSIYSKLEFM